MKIKTLIGVKRMRNEGAGDMDTFQLTVIHFCNKNHTSVHLLLTIMMTPPWKRPNIIRI